jgi:ribosomal protein L37AE/L43A
MGIVNEIEKENNENNLNLMDCPNCKSQMLNYRPKNEPQELWHVCSKCNISFTQQQHRYFTKMIKRLINEDLKPNH